MSGDPLLWHVTLTVAGAPRSLSTVDRALRRFQQERPFLTSLRYDTTRAEISYWEEGEDMVDAASLALRLWNEHRVSADLPPWKVVGLEVVERETYRSREQGPPLSGGETAPQRF